MNLCFHVEIIAPTEPSDSGTLLGCADGWQAVIRVNTSYYTFGFFSEGGGGAYLFTRLHLHIS